MHIFIYIKQENQLKNLTPLLNNNKQQQSNTTTSTSPSINVTSTITAPPIVINPNHCCKHHQGQVTDIYCKDCNDVICFKCALFNHKLHNYVNEIVKEEQEKIKKLVKDLETKKEVLLQRNKKVELTITKVNKQYELNKNEIKKQFNDLQSKLNNKMEKLFFNFFLNLFVYCY